MRSGRMFCVSQREIIDIVGKHLLWNRTTTTANKLLRVSINHWGKADDRNYNYGHPKMADVESGKNLFCRLNCFYNVF